MVKRNPNFAKLQAGYLFPEINRRKKDFIKNNPDAKIISLGIGDTTEPLTPYITKALKQAVEGMSTVDGYSGYGAEQGMQPLREAIAEKLYNGLVSGDEVFVSDGAKPDTGRLQLLFGADATIAVQDPSYPVYVDSSVMMGQTQELDESTGQFKNIVYMPCTPENNFFPDLEKTKKSDIIFFCNPNNPTGAVASREQLEQLVAFAKKNNSIIIYDSAYAQYIRDDSVVRSIYEIEGAKEVAIEISSFSKPIGFTGVRLGWTVIPEELKFDDGSSVHKDWTRVMTTIFNGASNIVQLGGIAALDKQGLEEMSQTVDYYMESAQIIKSELAELGYEVYGGDHAPYIWTRFPKMGSWDAFSHILKSAHVVCTPGVGFGPAGEGFVRFSAFGHRKDVLEAVERLKKMNA